MATKKEENGFITRMLALLIAVWLFWLVYCWVAPQVWPTGPVQYTQPGYWLTVGVVWCLRFVRNILRWRG